MRYISTALAACFTLSTLPARAIPEGGIRVLRIDRSGIHALPDLRLATTNLASKSDASNDLVKMKKGTDDFVLQCNASLSPLTDEKIIARSEKERFWQGSTLLKQSSLALPSQFRKA